MTLTKEIATLADAAPALMQRAKARSEALRAVLDLHRKAERARRDEERAARKALHAAQAAAGEAGRAQSIVLAAVPLEARRAVEEADGRVRVAQAARAAALAAHRDAVETREGLARAPGREPSAVEAAGKRIEAQALALAEAEAEVAKRDVVLEHARIELRSHVLVALRAAGVEPAARALPGAAPPATPKRSVTATKDDRRA